MGVLDDGNDDDDTSDHETEEEVPIAEASMCSIQINRNLRPGQYSLCLSVWNP